VPNRWFGVTDLLTCIPGVLFRSLQVFQLLPDFLLVLNLLTKVALLLLIFVLSIWALTVCFQDTLSVFLFKIIWEGQGHSLATLLLLPLPQKHLLQATSKCLSLSAYTFCIWSKALVFLFAPPKIDTYISQYEFQHRRYVVMSFFEISAFSLFDLSEVSFHRFLKYSSRSL